MENTHLRDALLYAGIAAQALLLIRVLQLRLTRRYPVLAAYLVFSLIRAGALVYLLPNQIRLFGLRGYSLVYVLTRPVLWVFYFLLILEFYSLMLEEFPGIRRLGRLVSLSGLAAVTLACCVLLVSDREGGFDRFPFLSYLALQERSVFLCLSTVTLLLLLFVAHYRLSIRRNVWILCLALGGYFLAEAVLLTLRRHFGQDFARPRDLLNALFFFFAMLGPVLFLSKAGETETHPISIIWGRRNRELEAALAVQLRSFNQVLVKALRQ